MEYSRAYKRYVVALLLVVYTFNQTDRAIFGFLMEPIKRELSLTDSQLGFLAGPALVLFYATLGIPIARFADRRQRVSIIAIAVALWSGIVICSAAVGSFLQLALVRVGVGVGEAGFSAVAQSVIGDYHSSNDRPRALSIFMLALPLGALVSNLMGGWANALYGWRAAFILAGVPGLLLAILVKTTIREPPRGSVAGSHALLPAPALRVVFRTLWTRRSLRHLSLAMVLMNAVGACFFTWIPTFFVRAHHMASGELGAWLAIAVSAGGALGTWLGGLVPIRLAPQDQRVQVRIVAVSALLCAPLLVAVLMSTRQDWALSLYIPACALLFFYVALSFSLLQGLSTASTRATLTATVILGQTLLAGAGLQLVGILSDGLSLRLGIDSLRWSLVGISVLVLWAAVHFWICGRTLRDDLRLACSGV
jgi:MFS family permease